MSAIGKTRSTPIAPPTTHRKRLRIIQAHNNNEMQDKNSRQDMTSCPLFFIGSNKSCHPNNLPQQQSASPDGRMTAVLQKAHHRTVKGFGRFCSNGMTAANQFQNRSRNTLVHQQCMLARDNIMCSGNH